MIFIKKTRYEYLDATLIIFLVLSLLFLLFSYINNFIYEHSDSANTKRISEIELIPFNNLATGKLSSGDTIKTELLLDYPNDKLVTIQPHSKFQQTYTYQVENDNGKSKVVIKK